MKLTYDEWFKLVDAAVKAKIGLSVNDLDDCCLKDWYSDRCSVERAAKRAIKYSLG